MKKFGLLGETLSHSFSPVIHAELGDYDYDLFEVAPTALKAFFGLTTWTGINVTIPYKTAALAFCDELGVAAREIGSVNTVIRRADGTLFGDNTDATGFVYLLKDVVVKNKKILVLGSGGSSKTVQHVLAKLGAQQIIVISRTGINNYDNLAQHYDDTDIIVNTTPVGMYPTNGNAPLTLAPFSKLTAVIDLVYNPHQTALLFAAKRQKITAIGGLGMLVAQAAAASTLFTGLPVATSQIEVIIKQIARKTQNIILIGMPGAGKSTVAAELAQISGRQIIDTDEQIALFADKSIAEIFATEGEAAFRKYEQNVMAHAGMWSGKIIATGGGCVKTPANYEHLKQNGIIFWLKRPVAALGRDDRPLSTGDLSELYEERRLLYDHFADFSVDNITTVTAVAQQIWREFNENFNY